MKFHLQSVIIITASAFIVTSCGSSPEDIGKKIAEKECACKDDVHARMHPKLKDANEKILADLKSNKFKSYNEYSAEQISYFKGTDYYNDEEYKKCRAELKKMQDDAKLEFSKEDDRRTIMNAYNANLDVCEESTREIKNERIGVISKLQEEVNQAVSNLPRTGF